jgi:hypothetical protein
MEVHMRHLIPRIVVPLGAATMIACSQFNPAAPTKFADANSSTVATPFEVAADVQSDGGKVVRITSGQLTVVQSPVTRTLELKGTAGVRLSAWFEPAAAFSADDCQPCLPGDSVGLDGILSGLSLSGTLTFRGQTYRLGSGNFDAGAHLVFTGEGLVLPPFTADRTVTLGGAPFALTGMLHIPGAPPAGVATAYTLSGQGIATLVFEERLAAPEVPVWFITSVVFDFGH